MSLRCPNCCVRISGGIGKDRKMVILMCLTSEVSEACMGDMKDELL
jgi:hypothetical protein